LDDGILAVELGVQATAAKAYFRQLIILGLLAEDGIPTALADRWRQDDEQAIDDILSNTYPPALLELAPRDQLDRAKVVRWFTQQGYGSGAANNKAATYMLVAQPYSEEASSVTPALPKGRNGTQTVRRRSQEPSITRKSPPNDVPSKGADGNGDKDEGSRRPQLAVNVQIHISADASSDQIDSIFAAMRRYFDESD
jgi:hypothetical protein